MAVAHELRTSREQRRVASLRLQAYCSVSISSAIPRPMVGECVFAEKLMLRLTRGRSVMMGLLCSKIVALSSTENLARAPKVRKETTHPAEIIKVEGVRLYCIEIGCHWIAKSKHHLNLILSVRLVSLLHLYARQHHIDAHQSSHNTLLSLHRFVCFYLGPLKLLRPPPLKNDSEVPRPRAFTQLRCKASLAETLCET